MARVYELSDDGVVVVIGSGAGGGTVANELAQRGVDVVCLEAGSRLTFPDIVNDPPVMDGKMTWTDRRDGPGTWLCKTVGGTTMRWSGVALRLQEHELRPLTTYGAIEGASLIDWPLTLEELAPYYALAEAKMGVSGTSGLPPSAETNNYKVHAAAAKLLGYTEFSPARMAINPVAYDNRPGCRQLGFCHEGCAIGAKWSTLYTEIPKAEATDRFELRPNAMAVRINHDAAGKVTGVVYVDGAGVMHEQKARAVCVAGNVAETTRILLNSSSSLFPQGLGNSTDQVGRHYMRHVVQFVRAVMPGPVHAYRGARQTGVIYDESHHRPERGFAGGYTMQPAAFPPGGAASAFSGWGEVAAAWMEGYPNMAAMFVCGEDPPQADNRITLHPTDTDGHGLPVPVFAYTEHANTAAMGKHAVAQGTKLYEALGATQVIGTEGLQLTCHNMGVARMSADAKDGVTNAFGQAHDVANLFVSDGSVLASSGAENPTLTIVALAIRQAEHIAGRMARGEL
jgi:choline dehydrogenase-like flavoprotein